MSRLDGPFVGLVVLCVARVAFHVGVFVGITLGSPLVDELPIDALELALRSVQFIVLLIFLGTADGISEKADPTRGTSPAESVVLSFFIPFANLVMPAKNVGDLVARLARRAGRMTSPIALVYFWWLAWTGTTISTVVVNASASETAYYVSSAFLLGMLALEVALASSIRTLAAQGDAVSEANATVVADVFR